MRIHPRLALATGLAKGAAATTRLLGRGGGTAVPGLVAERVDPRVLARLSRQLGRGRVMITGTNGKTTTARIASSIVDAAGIPAIHNREGSNLTRGLVSTLVGVARANGRIPNGRRTMGLFEVDEATLPAATAAAAPKVMVFTNLFRDQLDRYGEVDHVAALWRRSLARAPRDATLVLNADDPSVAELALDWNGPVHWFGINDPNMRTTGQSAFDARWSRRGGHDFHYEDRYFAHIGHWYTDDPEWRRPEPDTVGGGIELGVDTASFEVAGLGRVEIAFTGLYNIYNALAAIALARVLGIDAAAIREGAAAARPAFGRQEMFDFEGRKLRLMLTKNPAGANQVIQLLAALPGQHHVAVLLNDRFADGQDVSWIWDADFELLQGRIANAWAGGGRADDMALRLAYAGWPEPVAHEEPGALLDAILAGSTRGDDVFVIPTYTAMLDLRAELARRGAAAQFWDQ